MRARREPPFITGLGRSEVPLHGDLVQYVLVTIVLLLLALAGWLYLSTTVRVDAVSVRIYQQQQEKEALRRENAQQRAALAEKDSLSRVRSEAERMGYSEQQPGQQIEVSVPKTDKQGTTESIVDDGASLWRWLTDVLKGDSGSGQ